MSDDISLFRRMIAEPTTTTYSDLVLADTIKKYPVEDARGEGPWVESETTPGRLETNPDWTPTYDLNSAAGDIWAEKAATAAGNFDFSADGGNYNRSQVYKQMMEISRYYRSRRGIKTITMRPEPLMQGTEEGLDDDE